MERTDFFVERTDYFVERSDYWLERSDLERSDYGTKWPLMAANHLVRRSFDKISVCSPWLVITLGTLQKLRSGRLFLSLEHPTIRQNEGIATRREESRDRFHSSNMAEPTFHLRHSHVTAQTLLHHILLHCTTGRSFQHGRRTVGAKIASRQKETSIFYDLLYRSKVPVIYITTYSHGEY